MMPKKLNREELAVLEVGHTTISRSLSRALVFCFLCLIFTVPILQAVWDSRSPEQQPVLHFLQNLMKGSTPAKSANFSSWSTIKQNNIQLLQSMDDFEKQLEEGSFLRAYLLAPGQRLLLGLGYGNEKVYPGKESWLFYRPDMDYLMGPPFLDPKQLTGRREGGKLWEKPVQPDPLQTIVEFSKQLGRRGIQLIIMPTPIKASIHPEFFSGGAYHPPLQNRSWQEFVRQLHQFGVPLFDPASILVEHMKQIGTPVYLRTDTHWRADAMEVVAEKLAQYINELAPLTGETNGLQRQQETISNRGDIDAMLRMPANWSSYPEEKVQVHPVMTRGSEMWQGTADAEILLLGDSFSNIYSLAGMDWGEGAGLGEQLSYYLQRPVDLLLQNDAGAYATRELLSKELARGRDRLAGKKIVIWQFASRELASGDWKKIPMELKAKTESTFYTPKAGESKNVTATLVAISRSPVPGSVPYKENIVTLHLDDIRDMDTGEEYGQALVYGWGMKDSILTPFARLRSGDQIRLKLVDWDLVQGQYSSYRRSTLDDEMLELELPVWGEMLP